MMSLVRPERFVFFSAQEIARLAGAVLFAAACSVLSAQSSDSLRILAAGNGVYFGCAVGSALGSDSAYRDLVARECNIVVCENGMKWASIHPSINRYSWGPADSLVSFAGRNRITVHGHCLIWHQAAPSWITTSGYTRQQMLAAMKDHITTVVGHYKGTVSAWDVVNEAIDDGSAVMRNTFWLQKIGTDYIDSAFAYAHAADSSALLYYNDYSAEGMGTKSQKVYDLVSGMVKRGVPLHGVGFQCHFQLYGFKIADMERNIQRLAALGLKINFSEVDIRLEMPADQAALDRQGADYYNLMALFLKYRTACRAFLTWGITDRYSWIPDFFPGYGAALPFDSSYAGKPAFAGLLAALNEARSTGVAHPDSRRVFYPRPAAAGKPGEPAAWFDLSGRVTTCRRDRPAALAFRNAAGTVAKMVITVP